MTKSTKQYKQPTQSQRAQRRIREQIAVSLFLIDFQRRVANADQYGLPFKKAS